MQSHSHIAVIGNNWFPDKPGGLDRYTYELVHTLEASDNRVDLFGIGLPPENSTSLVHLTNLANSDATLWQRFCSAYSTSKSLKSFDLDAVNIHFALYGLAALPNIPKHLPITCTFHGPWAAESQQEGDNGVNVWFKQKVEQILYHRCDQFIVLSRAFGEVLHRYYGVSWKKIHVIPGGVNIERFRPTLTRQEAREQLGWPQDRFILFTPRRLVNRMGLDKLLLAIAQLKEVGADLWLAVAGRGPLKQKLEQQVSALGLDQQVLFLGFLPDELLPIAYQAADLTVMPSQDLEGFGLVLLESLACGTPALCTPIGGMPEVIYPFSPNLITAETTTESLMEHINYVLTCPTALPNSEACREYVVENFSWHQIAHQVKQVLLQ